MKSSSETERETGIFQSEELVKRTMGNVPFAKKLVARFLVDSPPQLKLLQACVEQVDIEEARKQAHKIKGALGNLGANLLSQKMQDIEKACNAEDIALLTRLTDEIPEEYRVLKHALEKWLHETTDS